VTRVKICGVTSAADRDAVVASGADAVGVITDVPVDTPREVSADAARNLLAGVPPFVTGTLVTMPDSVQDAVTLVDKVAPDALQVHTTDGLGGPHGAGALRDRIDVPLIVAVDADDPGVARAFDDVADALLVDSVDAAGGGGTGETHDWERTRAVADTLDAPLVLAGGLTPENVADAIDTVAPYAVDTATGVEAAGGEKDHAAVRGFVQAAGRAPASATEGAA
jgi:phosphoribosylanthranilate isomerase